MQVLVNLGLHRSTSTSTAPATLVVCYSRLLNSDISVVKIFSVSVSAVSFQTIHISVSVSVNEYITGRDDEGETETRPRLSPEWQDRPLNIIHGNDDWLYKLQTVYDALLPRHTSLYQTVQPSCSRVPTWQEHKLKTCLFCTS